MNLKSFPRRSKNSHKGIGGRLLIIGGSIDYYGSPILAGLAALHTGTDLVYLFVPECNFDVTRKPYPDFIVKKYAGEYLNLEAAKNIVSFANECDAVVLGPGVSRQASVVRGIEFLVEKIKKPLVLDADAIQKYKKLKKNIVVTPHAGEFKRLTGKALGLSLVAKKKSVASAAQKLGCTILLKGPVDVIASPTGKVGLSTFGNPGMTVGGTGDVLAGVVGSLLAKKVFPFDAALMAADIVGAAGDRLYTRAGIGYKASDLANELAPTVHNLLKDASI